MTEKVEGTKVPLLLSSGKPCSRGKTCSSPAMRSTPRRPCSCSRSPAAAKRPGPTASLWIQRPERLSARTLASGSRRGASFTRSTTRALTTGAPLCRDTSPTSALVRASPGSSTRRGTSALWSPTCTARCCTAGGRATRGRTCGACTRPRRSRPWPRPRAGGRATDGEAESALDVAPEALHSRAPFFAGSSLDMEELLSYGDVRQAGKKKYDV